MLRSLLSTARPIRSSAVLATATNKWRSFTTAACKPLMTVHGAATPLRARLHTSSIGAAGASQPRITARPPLPPPQRQPPTGSVGSNSNGRKRNSDTVGTGIAVPIIDLSRYFNGSETEKRAVAKQIGEACERIGFMTVTGHGISRELVDRAWNATRSYFDLSVAEKNRVPMTHDYPYGYIGFANENLSRGYDGKRSAPDLKECFCIGPYNTASGMPGVRWPVGQPLISNAWLEYYQAMEKLSASMLRLFALSLSLNENWFDDKITRHRSAFRMLNYPAQEVAPLPGQIRAGEHTDYGTLTILKSDERVSGLQVLARDGKWYGVEPVRDSFVVNIGDLMQRWTNDQWVSTLHRVVNPIGQTVTNERRQSMAFFHNLNGDAVVQTIPTCITPSNPSKYPPIEAWKHLIEKHEASTKGVKM